MANALRRYKRLISLLSRQDILVSARRSLKRILVVTCKGFAKAKTKICAARLGSAQMAYCGVAKLERKNHYVTALCSYHYAICGSNEKGRLDAYIV